MPTNAPVNVLVVDDERNIRKTLAICLEAEGHRVTAVGNFQDAVAEASRRSFHMAFVDLRLGTASGTNARSRTAPSRIPIVYWFPILAVHVCRCLGEDPSGVILSVDVVGDGSTTPSNSL